MRMKMWLRRLSLLLSLLCPCTPKPVISAIANPSIKISGPIAMPDCRDKCGNISIPYPFGIGDMRCAKEHKFLLHCNNSQPLLLGSIPVRSISLKGTVTVTLKTQRQCFSNDGITTKKFYGGVNLRDSPFMINRSNEFVVFGCNTTALITNDQEYRRGCSSFCNGPVQQAESSCAGIGCCKTSIPKQLNSLNLTLFSITAAPGSNQSCVHAFLTTKPAFSIAGLNLSKLLKHPVSSEVILDWVAGDETCQAARNSSRTYACGKNTDCFSSTNGSGYRCSCRQGFWGNPYLPQGCQDINECDDPTRYPCEGSCENAVGSYTCTRNDETEATRRRYVGDGILGALAAALSIVFLLLITRVYWWYQLMKKKKITKLKKKFFNSNGGLLLQQHISSDKLGNLKIFSEEELEKATDSYNENRILGKGGQGIVYRGTLLDGSVAAIKKSKKMDEAQTEYFINEVVILSQINHRHVVKLLGCCLETEVPLLVYEFVSNGSLSNHIHDQIEGFPMKFWDRLRIAKEVAGAIAHMHSAADVPIYHRDIKSSNILLDGKYRAKLSDFGISRLVPTERSHLTTKVQGTFGYLDPEYFQSNQYTEKSDVYSFGVVLVELLTGQKPISSLRSQDMGLAALFISSAKKNCLFDMLDPQVVKEGEKEELVILANLAMRCLKLNGRKRPTMKEVSLELENLKKPQEHLPAEPDHQDEAWEESCEEIRDALGLDIEELLNSSSSFTNKGD